MKLSKEELKKKITEVVADEDTQIALLEDIEDSFVESEDGDKVKKSTYDELEIKYNDLKSKYKERFLKGDDVEDEDAKEDDEELKEEEVIDVKEI
jgi:hypothetical protein|nr:MAG TPA: hypothetical protein [Caudoviricetes sp.]